ncbi:MAG: DUF3418 domain-containing protein, partial [Actinomycetota bacterium]|nr:DUF3418 domain-containing protein [Actinomycetota bacterium]
TAVRTDLHDTVLEVVSRVADVLSAADTLRQRLEQMTAPALRPAVQDVQAQMRGLLHPGFVTGTGLARLPDLSRYLRAVQLRLDRLPTAVHRDLEQMDRVQALEDALDTRLESADGRRADALGDVRWMIEELRVSLFAQQLGTRHPVSEKRVRRALDQA